MRQPAKQTAAIGRFGTAVVLALLGLGGVTACQPPPGGADYQEVHPIRTRLETFRADIPYSRVTAAQPLPALFVEEYYRRGRGPMTIILPPDADATARRAAQHLTLWLDDRLIPTALGRALPDDAVPTEDDSVSGGGTDDELTVIFKAYVALVPECGDWRGEAGFNPTNRPHTNFGCSYQRNIGMMLSDPGDLHGAPATGPADTPRLVEAIRRYRSGDALGSDAPRTEEGVVSDVNE